MKQFILNILFLITYLISFFAPFWAAIEFILYLAKDDPFNWFSFWLCPISWILLVISILAVKSTKS